MSDITFGYGAVDEVRNNLHHSAKEKAGLLLADPPEEPSQILVARFEQSVVGYLATAEREVDGLLVWEHFVVHGFRGQGVGRRLLLEAARRTLPRSKVTIDPSGDFEIERVISYYSRLGFPDASKDEFRVSAPAYRLVDAIGEQSEDDATLETVLRRKPPGVITIGAQSSVAEALAVLAENQIGCVVVSDDGVKIDGLLTERDLIRIAHERGPAVFDCTVGDCMTADVTTVAASDGIADVMEVVTKERLRNVPVMKDGKLHGLVSVGDLLVFRMREHDMRRERLPLRRDHSQRVSAPGRSRI